MAKSWRTIRGQRPLNESRVATYKRLIDAELRLADVRRRRGLSQAAIAEALEVSQPNVSRIEQEDDVYLSTLARYVAALGGHLEVLAVFPEETVTVLREPEAGDGDGAA
jgi:transcriptional regulator with XRE-family HTH domain